MKKMITLLLCLSMLLTVCAVTVPTAALNDSVNDSTWSEIELKALVYQEGKSFYSALAKGYENYESGWKEISELDDEEREVCSINMRGFCVTPDGKYALMGHLNGSIFRGCALYDFASGAITDVYYRFDSEQDPDVAQGPFSYVKGIAADDRGNVYCGFSFSTNFNLVSLGIAHIDDQTKQFEDLWEGPVYQFGDQPGDANGIQVGINGVEVASGTASGDISLAVGDNAIQVVVKNNDGEETVYTIIVSRDKEDVPVDPGNPPATDKPSIPGGGSDFTWPEGGSEDNGGPSATTGKTNPSSGDNSGIPMALAFLAGSVAITIGISRKRK